MSPYLANNTLLYVLTKFTDNHSSLTLLPDRIHNEYKFKGFFKTNLNSYYKRPDKIKKLEIFVNKNEGILYDPSRTNITHLKINKYHAVINYFRCLEYLEINDPNVSIFDFYNDYSYIKVGSLPEKIKELRLYYIHELTLLPKNLNTLYLCFCKFYETIEFPSTLEKLVLKDVKTNKRLILPSSLKSLTIIDCDRLKLTKLPEFLEVLKDDGYMELKFKLPNSLRVLDTFNYNGNFLPPKLEVLIIHNQINSLPDLPQTLQVLKLYDYRGPPLNLPKGSKIVFT